MTQAFAQTLAQHPIRLAVGLLINFGGTLALAVHL